MQHIIGGQAGLVDGRRSGTIDARAGAPQGHMTLSLSLTRTLSLTLLDLDAVTLYIPMLFLTLSLTRYECDPDTKTNEPGAPQGHAASGRQAAGQSGGCQPACHPPMQVILLLLPAYYHHTSSHAGHPPTAG